MKPAAYDLPITRGDDFVLPFNITSRDSAGVRTPVNLAGYSFESKLIASDGTLTTITVTVVSAAAGSVKLTIASTVTTALTQGYKWYFAVIDPSTGKQTYMDGDVLVRDRGSRVR